MYRKILLPTDGSQLSQQAVNSGIRLAKQAGAAVVGIHVMPVPQADQLEAWMHHDSQYAERRAALFEKFSRECLAYVSHRASVEGVPCICHAVEGDQPYREIVHAAESMDCDLIYMASHGWRGDSAGLPGSETIKVLSHSKIPVLVYKPAPLDHRVHEEEGGHADQ